MAQREPVSPAQPTSAYSDNDESALIDGYAASEDDEDRGQRHAEDDDDEDESGEGSSASGSDHGSNWSEQGEHDRGSDESERERTPASAVSSASDSSAGGPRRAIERPARLPRLGPHRKRTPVQKLVRSAALYLVPAALTVPASTLLVLHRRMLAPLYNDLPLSLHRAILYGLFLIPPSLLYVGCRLTSEPKKLDSRTCLAVSALAGDIGAVAGRHIGSALGRLGPEWGALASRWALGVAVIGGCTVFALVCYVGRLRAVASIVIRAAVYLGHVYVAERVIGPRLQSSILVASPEKSMLFVSFVLTIVAFLLRPPPATPLSSSVRLARLSPQARRLVSRFTPRSLFPLFLLVRLPLLAIFMFRALSRRAPPYLAAHDTLRVLSSVPSLTGQIVVAENLSRGYRFLRCDHSLLGGLWISSAPDPRTGVPPTVDKWDSIFATFPLQELGVLVDHGIPDGGVAESIQRTLDLPIEPYPAVAPVAEHEKRALVIGLGVGITASSFARRGTAVDVVELDPAVYDAAMTHFGLAANPPETVHLTDGAAFIHAQAEMHRNASSARAARQSPDAENEAEKDRSGEDATEFGEPGKWDYVVQDCFTAGSVPYDVFTREFWEDVRTVTNDDAVVVMNFAGLIHGVSARSALHTLTSVFPQCRAFGDGLERHLSKHDLANMVVICSPTLDPLLTFRRPTPADVLRSPLRAHVYSTFHANEIPLDAVLGDGWDALAAGEPVEHGTGAESLVLRRDDQSRHAGWGTEGAMATWRAMQGILTPDMWRVW